MLGRKEKNSFSLPVEKYVSIYCTGQRERLRSEQVPLPEPEAPLGTGTVTVTVSGRRAPVSPKARMIFYIRCREDSGV